MTLSADEKLLLMTGLLYLAIVVVWAFSLQARGRSMLRTLRERMQPELWQAVGAPESLGAAMRDPQRRWRQFIASGAYRRQLGSDLAEVIDDFRRRANRMLIVCGLAALVLLFRFGPLLMPGLFGDLGN